ncbi:F-box/LRR-repeat protein 4-like [Camellia sinensis]|uniref:F-box/LRR-repeat protein 4-like n=1 Tax=Camellia sinensis TaxID=4442 RepID=UPI0010359E33|nr:F-box/LRR-repeat protein 4-like [Camellia sinensis]
MYVQECQNLVTEMLGTTDENEPFQNLRDMAMTKLGEGCHLLKDIVLSHCRDLGLTHLVNKCTMLESCHMVYCPGINCDF